MTGTPGRWAATERIQLAEHEKYGDVGESRYDPVAGRRRNIKALQDPNYDITDRTLPPDRPRSRILQVIQTALEAPDTAPIETHARALAEIVTSTRPARWHATHGEVVATILSAAGAVDGEAASARLAELVAALARQGELTNPSAVDLTYEIGDHWVRPVTIPPGEALTGEGGLRIWSEMPGLRVWVRERLERLPGGETLYAREEVWPGNSWGNLVRFCARLSDLRVRGRSPVSAFWAEHGLLVMDGLFKSAGAGRVPLLRHLPAVYVEAFGREIRGLCERGWRPGGEGSESAGHGEEGDSPSGGEGYSLERWELWKVKFRNRAARAPDQASRDVASRAAELMQSLERA